MNLPFTIAVLVIATSAFGQHKVDKELNAFLKDKKIDTFIYIKSGCTNCSPSYEETEKKIDIVSIKLLYRQKGQQSLLVFSDNSSIKEFGQRSSSLFDYILSNKQRLEQKDTYYKDSKKEKFQAPCLVDYPYETVNIKIGRFIYRHISVKRETDDCGTFLTHHDWYITELEILSQFDRL